MESINTYINEQRGKPYYKLLITLLGAFFYAIAWYRPFTPLVFLSFAFLYELMVQLDQKGVNRPYLKLFAYSYLMFVLWDIGVYWWLWYASGPTTLGAWLVNGLLKTLTVLFAFYFRRLSKGKLGYRFFALSWITFEYVHLYWEFSWPWMNIGNVFSNAHHWVQWYEYTGVFGGALWILWVSYIAYYTFFEPRFKWGFLVSSIIFPIGISYIMYFSYDFEGKEVEVLVTQPNYDCYTQKYKYNANTGDRNSKSYIPYDQQVAEIASLIKDNITTNTRLALVPETALHSLKNEAFMKVYDDVKPFLKINQEHNNLSILLGVNSYAKLIDADTLKSTARFREGMGFFEIYNSGLFIGKEGATDIYRKSQLVIGVETYPYYQYFKDFVIDLGGVSGGLGRQKDRVSFPLGDSVYLAPIICYESIYGEFVTEYVKAGATFLAVITNDGWWDVSPGHLQHLRFAQLRAIECRKDVVRSANTGVSCFINQRGDVVSQTNYGEKRGLLAKVLSHTGQTYYVEYGDYIARLAYFILGFLALSAVVKRIKNLG